MTCSIDALVVSKVGFASHQNSAPIIVELTIRNLGEAAVEHCTLKLFADPPFLTEREWRIDAIAPEGEIQVRDRDVKLGATLLSGLSESMTAALSLVLSGKDGVELAKTEAPIELLAHNEWGGSGCMSDLLPAFVTPNDPAIDKVLKSASDALRRSGKPDSIDGYKSGERVRVWELTSAIWSAVSGMRLSYALPPANFERNGQKVRTPSQILEGRIGTCLDTSLLFAAAIEQAGLNPIVVLTKDHAFVGVWLQPSEFSSLVTHEAAALRRRIDIDELLVFESTLATNPTPPCFSQAIAQGNRNIAEAMDDEFEAAIDIRRARIQKIRPLGVAVETKANNEGEIAVFESVEAAPPLASFDKSEEDEVVTPAGRVKQWQRKLLNLTTSNRLLHLPDTSKSVQLICPEPGKLEDLLAEGKKIRIQPLPELDSGGRDEALYNQQFTGSLRDEVAMEALSRGEVLAGLPKDKLQATLIELYRKANADMEEGGANTLYLAVGFLKWKKSEKETKVYRAPLILVPVKLERKSALSAVTMIHHEDDPRFNLTLLELLRQDFELRIPAVEGDLPQDESGIDVAAIWRHVRYAIKDIPGFEVVEDVALGTFSFAKYLMWKDLVDRQAKLRESPLVRHLIDRDGRIKQDSDKLPRVEDLDAQIEPAELFTPLPADSSQLRAVIASARGQNFVLDGPPGTGKSQTIANMIAHNLAFGRRVLFVAEKRAALDVVHRRLTDKGLAPFCLELHSAKATKSGVLKQLSSAWDTRDELTSEEWQREAAETRVLRDRLNETVALLHRREPNGYTIYQAIGRYIRDGGAQTPRFSFPPTTSHSGEDMTRMRESARQLGIGWNVVEDVADKLATIHQSEWSNGWQEKLCASARTLPRSLDDYEAALGALIKAAQLPDCDPDFDAASRVLALVHVILSTHGKDLRFAFSPDMAEKVSAAERGLRLVEAYREEEAALSASYTSEIARRLDIESLKGAWSKAEARFWLLSTLARRSVAKELARAGGTTSRPDPAADIPRLQTMRDLLDELDVLIAKASAIPGWQGLQTRREDVETSIALGERLRQAIASHVDGAEELITLRGAVSRLVVDANELLGPDGAIERASLRLTRALEEARQAADEFRALANCDATATPLELREAAAATVANETRLRDWANWQRARAEAVQLDLMPLVNSLETRMFAAGSAIAEFETGYAHWFAIHRMDAEPVLRNFMAGTFTDCIARFRELDQRMSDLATRYVRSKICGHIPEKADVAKNSGYGILRHQLQLQRPSKPIRQLATEMGDAFTKLAPCMLMSPLSIAQYLPPDQGLFDLVIFDEASQITPWDAIGAMARGKQVIIAGDPRQMPPSSNFERQGSTNDDDDTEEDMESILDECLAAGVPQINLDWHYRSRHESLITFSNVRYYENRLVTFPAPDTRPSAVKWHRVDGVFSKGKERTNPVEAQAIVNEAVRLLRDPNFVDADGEPLSLGIITMNIQQMKLVEDLLDKARQKYPAIERFFNSDAMLEPVCVRNLETAQGDERDVILVGVGFGPTEPGGRTMSMNFGKLNPNGGWRRLNVAVTRARREMQVFTSFDPGMIDLTRTSADGVRDLKTFIEFASRGKDSLASADRGSLGGYDSPFEEAVADELRRRGWKLMPQVGVSKFRIDLGVVHPDWPGDFLCGVECDGATYHSAATARDRDRVRAAILEGLGWKLVRVWSTEWWFNRERAAEGLHQELEQVLAADRARREEAAASAASTTVPPVSEPASELGDVEIPILDSAAPSYHADAIAPDEAEQPEDEAGDVQVATFVEAELTGLSANPGVYQRADLSSFAGEIDAEQFYEIDYHPVLRRLIAHVVHLEGPIALDQLVDRVARAHGFQRSGNRIRSRIEKLARKQHLVVADGEASFVWKDMEALERGMIARYPASENDIRQINDIASAEMRATNLDDPVEIARLFWVRRLSASARKRIETAIGG